MSGIERDDRLHPVRSHTVRVVGSRAEGRAHRSVRLEAKLAYCVMLGRGVGARKPQESGSDGGRFLAAREPDPAALESHGYGAEAAQAAAGEIGEEDARPIGADAGKDPV